MVKVYSRENCSRCNELKNLLKQKGIEFETLDLDLNPLCRGDLISRNFRQLPVIVDENDVYYTMEQYLKTQ